MPAPKRSDNWLNKPDLDVNLKCVTVAALPVGKFPSNL